jgi:hypothetical protein
MAQFYSFVVWSPGEVPVPEAMTLLEYGSNTFNVVVKNLDEFKSYLEGQGVKIHQCNSLDEFAESEIPIAYDLLPGEKLQGLLPGELENDRFEAPS